MIFQRDKIEKYIWYKYFTEPKLSEIKEEYFKCFNEIFNTFICVSEIDFKNKNNTFFGEVARLTEISVCFIIKKNFSSEIDNYNKKQVGFFSDFFRTCSTDLYNAFNPSRILSEFFSELENEIKDNLIKAGKINEDGDLIED